MADRQFRQEPFTGRTPGQGEKEMPNPFDAASKFYSRNEKDRERINAYLRYDALMDVRTHYDAFNDMGPAAPRQPAREQWIPIDFFGMLARLMRHYTFGPEFHVRGHAGAENDAHVRRITATSHLLNSLNQSAETVSSLGDVIFRVDVEDIEDENDPEGETIPQAVIRAVHPAHYFPKLDPLDSTRVEAVTLAWVFPVDAEFKGEQEISTEHVVLFEINEIGSVRYELWAWDGKEKGEELSVASMFPELEGGATGIDEIPIVHVGMNVRSGNFWGVSDFGRIERIVFALESRLTQEDEVLDKHARPKLIVGPGILDPNGRSRLADFDVIEIEPSILEKAVKPEYLTWNMQITAIEHELEKLEEYLFITTETSPASFGLERDGSQVESARALRFKAHRTVNKVSDLRVAYDPAIKDLFRIAQKLENAAREEDKLDPYQRGPVELVWPDPIIEDQDAEVQNYVSRKAVGLVSRKRAVQDLDNLTEPEAEAEVQEILQDMVDESAAAATTAPELPEIELPEAAGTAPVEEGAVVPEGEAPPAEA
jgi:hypothetical protein